MGLKSLTNFTRAQLAPETALLFGAVTLLACYKRFVPMTPSSRSGTLATSRAVTASLVTQGREEGYSNFLWTPSFCA